MPQINVLPREVVRMILELLSPDDHITLRHADPVEFRLSWCYCGTTGAAHHDYGWCGDCSCVFCFITNKDGAHLEHTLTWQRRNDFE